MTNEAKSELLMIGDLLCRCMERRPDNLKRVLAEQAPALVRLKAALDPITFEGKVAGLLHRACVLANPAPALTAWDVAPPKKPVPVLQEVLEFDPVSLGSTWPSADFAEFQRLLRAASHEDARPSDKRKFVEMRPTLQNMRRIYVGSSQTEIIDKALGLIANVAGGAWLAPAEDRGFVARRK